MALGGLQFLASERMAPVINRNFIVYRCVFLFKCTAAREKKDIPVCKICISNYIHLRQIYYEDQE